jgi:hypothetical protein
MNDRLLNSEIRDLTKHITNLESLAHIAHREGLLVYEGTGTVDLEVSKLGSFASARMTGHISGRLGYPNDQGSVSIEIEEGLIQFGYDNLKEHRHSVKNGLYDIFGQRLDQIQFYNPNRRKDGNLVIPTGFWMKPFGKVEEFIEEEIISKPEIIEGLRDNMSLTWKFPVFDYSESARFNRV